jgi:glycosidase
MAANKSKGDGALRQDFPGGWQGDKNNAFTKEGRTDLQNWYFNFTKNLLNWRKNCDAVHDGKLIHFHVRNGVYVYAREKNGQVVTVIVNGTTKNQTLDLTPYAEVLPKAEAENILTHKRVKCAGEMRLRPKEIRVLDFTK